MESLRIMKVCRTVYELWLHLFVTLLYTSLCFRPIIWFYNCKRIKSYAWFYNFTKKNSVIRKMLGLTATNNSIKTKQINNKTTSILLARYFNQSNMFTVIFFIPCWHDTMTLFKHLIWYEARYIYQKCL